MYTLYRFQGLGLWSLLSHHQYIDSYSLHRVLHKACSTLSKSVHSSLREISCLLSFIDIWIYRTQISSPNKLITEIQRGENICLNLFPYIHNYDCFELRTLQGISIIYPFLQKYEPLRIKESHTHVAIKHLKCGWPELGLGCRYKIQDFKDLVQKSECKMSH